MLKWHRHFLPVNNDERWRVLALLFVSSTTTCAIYNAKFSLAELLWIWSWIEIFFNLEASKHCVGLLLDFGLFVGGLCGVCVPLLIDLSTVHPLCIFWCRLPTDDVRWNKVDNSFWSPVAPTFGFKSKNHTPRPLVVTISPNFILLLTFYFKLITRVTVYHLLLLCVPWSGSTRRDQFLSRSFCINKKKMKLNSSRMRINFKVAPRNRRRFNGRLSLMPKCVLYFKGKTE